MPADRSQLSRLLRTRRRHARGAVLLETLIVFPPLFALFFGMLQLVEVFAAGLLVRRAASAAVRAAVVVLPDDPEQYHCSSPNLGKSPMPQGVANACMFADVVEAAREVLAAGRGFGSASAGDPVVRIKGALEGHNLITAEVSASYTCFVPPLGFACGLDRSVQFTASASLPYQKADYDY